MSAADSSDSDEENVFNIFKPGVKFDIIEDEDGSSIADDFAPKKLPFLSQLEKLFLLRKRADVKNLIDEHRNSEVPLNEVEVSCVHLASLILNGEHIYLFKEHKDANIEAALQPAKALWLSISGINDFSLSTGLPDIIRSAIVRHITDGTDSYSRQCRGLLSMLLGCLFLEIYIQSNYTGPELSPEFYNLLRFPQLHEENHANGIANLSVDGECAFRQCDLPHALILARTLLCTVCDSTKMLWEHGIELNEAGDVMNKLHSMDNDTLTTKQACSSLISRQLWSFRAGIIHLRVLQRQSYDAMPSLWKECQDNIKATLTAFHCDEFFRRSDELSGAVDGVSHGIVVDMDDRCLFTQIWLECGLCNHYFDQGDKGRQSFQKAQRCSRLITNLSGAIGKRTKHQVHSHAQMYLYAQSQLLVDTEGVSAAALTASAAPKAEEKIEYAKPGPVWEHGKYEIGKRMVIGDESTGGEEVAVREVLLDEQDGGAEENILLEGGARFAKDERTGEGGDVFKGGPLHAIDQAVLLSLCLDVQNSNPADGLTSEEMFPYLHRVLELPNNWMIHSTALLERSWLEFEKRRTADRAMLQMQALLDQHTTKLTMTQNSFKMIEEASPVQDRIEFIYSLVYPAQYELKRDLAYKYLQSQVFVSALNMFQELELWDEVVKCYQLLQKPYRAEMVVREQIKKLGETPYMLTALGDLTSDENCYERAWKLSNGRFARAKRTLGHICFTSDRYEQAIAHFDDALGVQPLVANAWYMRGLCCMRLERYDESIVSFNRCVQQDCEIGEAWGNIGAVHYHREEFSKALPALKEALKHKANNFRVLQNLVLVTIQLKLYVESCMYMTILVDIRHTSKQLSPMIPELQLICRGILELETPTEFVISKFEALLNKVSNAYPSDAEIWDVIIVFKYAVGKNKDGLENRFRQLRSLVTKSSWESSEQRVDKVLVVSRLLVEEIMEYNAKSEVYNCKSILQTVLRTFKAAVEANAQLSSKVKFAEDGKSTQISYESCVQQIADTISKIEAFGEQQDGPK